MSLTSDSDCVGITNLVAGLSCSVSSDLTTITVVVETLGTRRRLQDINRGTTIQLDIRNVKNPNSFERSDSFSYMVYTEDGYLIEGQDTDLTVNNTIPGDLIYTDSGAVPDNFRLSEEATYEISFEPVNYEQDMWVKVTLPSDLSLPQSSTQACDFI